MKRKSTSGKPVESAARRSKKKKMFPHAKIDYPFGRCSRRFIFRPSAVQRLQYHQRVASSRYLEIRSSQSPLGSHHRYSKKDRPINGYSVTVGTGPRILKDLENDVLTISDDAPRKGPIIAPTSAYQKSPSITICWSLSGGFLLRRTRCIYLIHSNC